MRLHYWRGIAHAQNYIIHLQYPFGSLDQNNLAHVGKAVCYILVTYEIRVFFKGVQKEVFSSI